MAKDNLGGTQTCYNGFHVHMETCANSDPNFGLKRDVGSYGGAPVRSRPRSLSRSNGMTTCRMFLARLSAVALLAMLAVVAAAGAHAQSGPPEGAHPHGTRTGIAAVDKVLEAFETGSSLADLLQPTPTECSANPQIGGTWCPEGTPDGTVIDTIFGGNCEGVGSAVDDPRLIRSLQKLVDGSFYLYGVAAGSHLVEGGRHVLYITNGPGFFDWTRLTIGDDGIMATSGGCDKSLEAEFAEETDVVFAPAGEDGDDPTPTPGSPGTGTGLAAGEPGDGSSGAAVVVVGVASAGAAALGAMGWRRRRS